MFTDKSGFSLYVISDAFWHGKKGTFKKNSLSLNELLHCRRALLVLWAGISLVNSVFSLGATSDAFRHRKKAAF